MSNKAPLLHNNWITDEDATITNTLGCFYGLCYFYSGYLFIRMNIVEPVKVYFLVLLSTIAYYREWLRAMDLPSFSNFLSEWISLDNFWTSENVFSCTIAYNREWLIAMDLPSFGSRWLGSRKHWDESLGQRLIPYGQAHKLKQEKKKLTSSTNFFHN